VDEAQSSLERLVDAVGDRRFQNALRDEHAATCKSVGCRKEDWPCRLLPSGWRMHLRKMIFTVRLGISHPHDEAIGDTDGWDYVRRDTVEAMIAFLAWDGEGDPPGPWIKNINTGRQGPGSTRYRADEEEDQDDEAAAR
jgi:hypothetical protein